MQIINLKKDIRKIIKQKQLEGKIISLVPTMGALHQGHEELIKVARKEADLLVCSIFINKHQFNDKDDFKNYPKTINEDIKICKKLNVDILFMPEHEEIYPNNSKFNFNINKLADKLCGKNRPNHFESVCLIICKLLNITQANRLYMGKKDYQQYIIINNLLKDLDYGTELIAVETKRLKSGLAFSSRNSKITEENLSKIAPLIYDELKKASAKLKANPKDYKKIIEQSKQNLILNGFEAIDYFEILDHELNEFNGNVDKSIIFVAAYLNNVRLIDNINVR